jgi:hypothetical protein
MAQFYVEKLMLEIRVLFAPKNTAQALNTARDIISEPD